MPNPPRITKELFAFFEDLKQNNDRDWFKANKQRYEEVVRDPLLSFVSEFTTPLKRTGKRGDLVVLTADHGNDPTWTGTDHTREQVPVLAFGPGIEGRGVGQLHTFADVAQTIAGHLALPPMRIGMSLM